MKLGVCGNPEITVAAKEAGLDYFEWSVGGFLQPRNDQSAFLQTLETVREASLNCPVLNVFIPGDLKITGPEVDDRKLETYVEIALERARVADVEIIVFGSGGARRVPDNFDFKKAYQQLFSFGQMIAAKAAQYELTIAVEPLNRQECNILNSVRECAAYVRDVNHPNFRLLVDAFHWLKEGETTDAILDAGELLVHAHIATPTNRLPPGAEGVDFKPFFDALRQTGYDGRLSIEARLDESNREGELRKAVETIQSYML